jgi:hypothetical protein
MNEEIERYVREERSRGTDEDTIRHALLGKGWEASIVDTVLAETRPGDIATLFSRSFFRFAFGFVSVIVLAVGLILVVGAISQGKEGSACIANCEHK